MAIANAPSIDGKIRALCCSWVCVSRLWQLLRLKLAVKCWTRRADRFAINDVKVLCDSNIFSFVHSTRSLLVGESWLIFRVFVNWQTLFLMPLQKKNIKWKRERLKLKTWPFEQSMMMIASAQWIHASQKNAVWMNTLVFNKMRTTIGEIYIKMLIAAYFARTTFKHYNYEEN